MCSRGSGDNIALCCAVLLRVVASQERAAALPRAPERAQGRESSARLQPQQGRHVGRHAAHDPDERPEDAGHDGRPLLLVRTTPARVRAPGTMGPEPAYLCVCREKDVVEKDAKLGGAGSGVAPKGKVRTVSGAMRPAPVRGGGTPTTLAHKSAAGLVDTLGQVKKRHEEREKQIAAEEAERQQRKDWKSGNMQEYYRKWDTFDESKEPEERPATTSSSKPASKASKVDQKLGPAGIAAPETNESIPTPQVLPRGLADNITALDDPTLNGGAREKDKGNSLYQNKRFGEAVAAYTRGLDVLYGKGAAECQATEQLQALKATLYCNRAMAHLKLENWELADADASSSLDLDPQMVKVRSPKLTVAFSQSSYISMTYRVVGLGRPTCGEERRGASSTATQTQCRTLSACCSSTRPTRTESSSSARQCSCSASSARPQSEERVQEGRGVRREVSWTVLAAAAARTRLQTPARAKKARTRV